MDISEKILNTDKSVTVSIIIPIYNMQQYLRECIDNILGQTFSNIEIIIVDDGSQEECAQLCDALELMHDCIKVIHKTNGGVSSARNAGLQIITGDYVYFCDGDDIPDTRLIERLVYLMESTSSELAACKYLRFTNQQEIAFSKDAEEYYLIEGAAKYSTIICDNSCGGYLWNKLFKTDIIKNNNLKFDEELFIIEDALFVVEYIEKANLMVFSNEVLYAYRNNPASITNQNLSAKLLTAALGHEKIYLNLKESVADDNVKKWVWTKLIQSVIVTYKKIRFRKDEFGGGWLERYKELFIRYYRDYNLWKSLSTKEKIYLVLIRYF